MIHTQIYLSHLPYHPRKNTFSNHRQTFPLMTSLITVISHAPSPQLKNMSYLTLLLMDSQFSPSCQKRTLKMIWMTSTKETTRTKKVMQTIRKSKTIPTRKMETMLTTITNPATINASDHPGYCYPLPRVTKKFSFTALISSSAADPPLRCQLIQVFTIPVSTIISRSFSVLMFC